MMNKLLVLFVFVFSFCFAQSQLGGSTSYQFLDLANSSRIQGLGGSNISIYDKDVNLALSNPALLDSIQSGSISLNYMNYVGDINYGYSSYTHHVNNVGTFNLAMMYANYGKFTRADETGTKLGEFVANDLSVIVGYGRKIDSLFSIGGNLKFFNSVYDVYNSNGIALDLAANFHKPSKLFSKTAMFAVFFGSLCPQTRRPNGTGLSMLKGTSIGSTCKKSNGIFREITKPSHCLRRAAFVSSSLVLFEASKAST